MSAHFLQPLDLRNYVSNKDGTLTYNRGEVNREDACYFQAPYTAPAYMRWLRILDKTDDNVTRLLGHTMELDVYGFGVKVYVRIGQDGTLKVFVEDSEGREVLASYVKP